MTRILLADNHLLVRAGIRSLIQSIADVEVIGEACNGREALSLTEKLAPDVVLMDIAMGDVNGIDATASIKKSCPRVSVVILSLYVNEAYVEQALRAGASGYLLKDSVPSEVERALDSIALGKMYLCPRVSTQLVQSYLKLGPRRLTEVEKRGASAAGPLSRRQREVLERVAQGRTTKEIAIDLEISPKTVEVHRMQLMNRLNIHNVPGLVRYAVRAGLVALDACTAHHLPT